MDVRMPGYLRANCVSRRVDIFNSSSMASSALYEDLDRKWNGKRDYRSVKGLISNYMYTLGKINKIWGQ